MEQDAGSLGRSGGPCRSGSPLAHHPRLPRSRARVDLRLPLHLGQAAARRVPPPPPPAAAAEQERAHHGWGYCRPVVALDVALNSAFPVVSAVVLLSTGRERPAMPIRAWVFGYALQCLIHMAFVCVEYRRSRQMRERGRWSAVGEVEEESRAVKKLKSINAMASLLWWILGFYWIVAGGQALLQDAPRLYWLTVVFLSFDVFFAFFCVTMASAIWLALCCCLPFTIAILHVVAGKEGASNTHLRTLPKFRFCQANRPDKLDLETGQVSITIRDQDSITDFSLAPEDSECCICLCQYEDGVELLSLPCNHHFHSDCVLKWLRINTTCPLCKHSILEEDEDDIPE